MQTQIRRATMADCTFCAQLSRIEELKTPDGKFMPVSFFQAHVAEDSLFFIAEQYGNRVGYLIAEQLRAKRVVIHMIAVTHDYRKLGVGKNLIAHLRGECGSMGNTDIIFFSPSFNEGSTRFFMRCGFVRGKQFIAFSDERECC